MRNFSQIMRSLMLTSVMGCAGLANAHNLQLNQPLPAVTVSDKGELVLNQGNIIYQPWQSKNLAGKVRILQHIAGRSSVKAKNDDLMTAIKAAGFKESHYQTTNIINADDAMWGTAMFVRNSVKKAKKENPRSQIVLDDQSTVQKAWDLKREESLIVVLDKQGNVQFAHEGKLSPAQIQQVISLARQLQK